MGEAYIYILFIYSDITNNILSLYTYMYVYICFLMPGTLLGTTIQSTTEHS